jgi:hypothetical protein
MGSSTNAGGVKMTRDRTAGSLRARGGGRAQRQTQRQNKGTQAKGKPKLEAPHDFNLRPAFTNPPPRDTGTSFG